VKYCWGKESSDKMGCDVARKEETRSANIILIGRLEGCDYFGGLDTGDRVILNAFKKKRV
jgi:hypothetical protein